MYIYGIINTNEPQEFGAIGIGEPASDVLTVGYQEIAAVASRSPLVVYDSLAKEKAIKDLVTHQFVVEKVMERFTILPVKFGTMLETEEEVVAFLKKGDELLSDELRKMAGKIELDVVASWNLQKILATLYRDNAPVQKKQQEIAAKGAKAGVEDKIALGRLIEQALQAEKTRYHQLVLQALKEEAIDACVHEVANDEMILNAAFLIDQKNEALFTEAVTVLDQKLEGAINFRLVGPLPVYSFATIVFDRIDPQLLEDAKQLFGLNREITEKTVRDTYRQLARKCHPDKSSGADSLTFPVLNAAYRTLKSFSEHGLMHVEVYHWEQGDRIPTGNANLPRRSPARSAQPVGKGAGAW